MINEREIPCPPTFLQLYSGLLCYEICSKISCIIEWIFSWNQEPDDSQEFYFDFCDAIFDFDVKDVLMAAIPLELLTVHEDSMDSDRG